MKSNEEINKLLAKINAGLATAEEKERLQLWYNSWDDSQTSVQSSGTKEDIKERIWTGMSINSYRSLHRWKKLGAVAAAVMLIGVTGTIFLQQDDQKRGPLTLSAGLEIQGINAVKQQITSDLDAFLDSSSYIDMSGTVDPGQLAQVKTQKGQFAKIKLPDGTRVSLNADTKIKLSADFEKSAQRVVELEGEAYFEVTTIPNRSFVVRTKEQEVHVLGTKFNIKAYPNQKNIVTSLVEGSIKLVEDGKSQFLKPNQKSINTIGTNALVVQDRDLQTMEDWKQLNFEFDNERIEEVLLQLGRWYGLEVIFDSSIPDQTISGKIERGTNLNDLQLILGNLTKAHYQLKENVLHVKF